MVISELIISIFFSTNYSHKILNFTIYVSNLLDLGMYISSKFDGAKIFSEVNISLSKKDDNESRPRGEIASILSYSSALLHDNPPPPFPPPNLHVLPFKIIVKNFRTANLTVFIGSFTGHGSFGVSLWEFF